MKTVNEKFRTVIEMNTFWFSNTQFEYTYEGYVNALKETLLHLKNRIEREGLSVELIADFLDKKREFGLKALLALTGISNEHLKRLVTFIRATDVPELNSLVYKDQWLQRTESNQTESIREWGDNTIQNKIHKDQYFRLGIANIFFEGATTATLSKALPLFHLKKLGFSKLNFSTESLLDTLVRYKEFGSYNAKADNNPERNEQWILSSLTKVTPKL